MNCPAVIKSYNANLGGIDKNDLLVHCYCRPMKYKRRYMQMFAYATDVSIRTAWVIYRWD